MSALPNTLSVRAWAKVNLFLRVLGRRDDGYHDLESLIVPICLADSLEVHAASAPAEFSTLSFGLDVGGEEPLARGVPRDESNLIIRAAKALADRVDARGFADVYLEKRIPSAAGLGGGSADAAATLRALNTLWGLGLDGDALAEVAGEVGSDVPALLPERPVVLRGRGERVEPAAVAGLNLVLVTFDFGVSTADAFGWWDEDGAVTGPEPNRVLREARLTSTGRGDLSRFGRRLFNDLEDPVTRRHPRVRLARDRLLAAGAAGAVMSGSGPTVVGLLPWGTTRLDPGAEADLEAIAGRPPRYEGSDVGMRRPGSIRDQAG